MLSQSGGKGYAPAPIPIGVNIGGVDYYTSNCPFIDLMHGTTSAWTGSGSGAVNSLGWLTDLPPGQSVSKYVLIHTKFPGGYIRPGRYVMTWSGPLTITNSGIGSNPVATANRFEFTLADAGEGAGALSASNSGGLWIVPLVSNTTGAPASLNDLKIFHIDDEADLLAGRIFQSSFLRSLDGVTFIRVMDLMGTNNNSAIVNFVDWPTEAHCSWTPYCPPSVIGKLAVAAGKDLWVCMPHKGTDACYQATAQAIWNEMAGSGYKVYVELSNENWNTASAYPQGEWLRLNVGPTIAAAVVDGNGAPASDAGSTKACAAAHRAMAAWAAFEQHFPRSRVVRVFAGQAANFNAMKPGFEYQDTVFNTYFPGQKLKNLVDEYAIAPYFDFQSAQGQADFPADLSWKVLHDQNYRAKEDSYWTRAGMAAIERVIGPWVQTSKTGAAAKRADIKLTSYELGRSDLLTLSASNMWPCIVNTADNTLDFGTSITGIFSEGEQAVTAWFPVALFSGWFQWTAYKLALVGTNKIRLFSPAGNYPTTPVTLNTDLMQTCTITVASPGVVSYTGVDAVWGESNTVRLTSTGSLPTGLSQHTTYYIKNLNTATKTFQLSLTAGGAAINTSGTQSGVHSVHPEFYAGNFGRYADTTGNWSRLMDSTAGAELYRFYFSKLVEYGLQGFCHFINAAGYFNIGSGGFNYFRWGLKRSQWESDANYPRAAWLRRFANGTQI